MVVREEVYAPNSSQIPLLVQYALVGQNLQGSPSNQEVEHHENRQSQRFQARSIHGGSMET